MLLNVASPLDIHVRYHIFHPTGLYDPVEHHLQGISEQNPSICIKRHLVYWHETKNCAVYTDAVVMGKAKDLKSPVPPVL